MNVKHIVTDKNYYISDGAKIYFGYDSEDDDTEITLGCRSEDHQTEPHDFYIPNTINGKSVTYIDGDTFDNFLVRQFIVEDDNEYFKVFEDALYTKDMKALISSPYTNMVKTFVLPSGVEEIYDSALTNKYIETLLFPEGFKKIWQYGVACAKNLKRVYIPKSLELIGLKAFWFTEPEDVFYGGSEEDRANIKYIDDYFCASGLLDAKWHYNFTMREFMDKYL